MATNTDDYGRAKVDLGGGQALYALPYDSEAHSDAIESELATKTEPPTDESTPDPTSDAEERDKRDGGPTQRINDVITDLGATGLESLALDNLETAKAIAKRSDELYRNEFPIITPRFQCRCEYCGAEYEDDELDECEECGATDELREVDYSERRTLSALFESVNKEGQSLREIMQMAEDDQSRLGVSTLVCKFNYSVAGDSVTVNGRQLAERGEVIAREFDELVRGDPKRIVPVIDEQGRIGGYWWTCPVHRDDAVAKEPGQCKHCGADLREVHYAELERASARRRENDITAFYFEEEVVMWSHHIPRLHGLDGVSPVHLIWVQQAILHWMNTYAVEYFDPHSNRTPNKFLMVHTTNPESFEKQLDEAEEDAQQDPYTNSIFYNEYSAESNSTPEVQVVDTMGDEFLGQSHELRKKFESQIRNTFGITDAQDSEMEDAGGLNAEGLQLEVTDRSIASAQKKLADGPLDRLLSNIGFEDWQLRYVPPQETALDDREQQMDVLRKAAEIGLPARMEDGEVKIGDGEAAAPESPEDQWESGPSAGAGSPQQPGGPSGPTTPGAPQQSAQTGREDDVTQKALADGSGTGADPLEQLEGAFKHIVWPDPNAETLAELGQKASDLYWSSKSRVPSYVSNRIDDALNSGTIWAGFDADLDPLEVRRFFKAELDDPAAWSLKNLSGDFADRFDVPEDEAITIVRSEAATVLNAAREEGYRQQGDLDGREFYWQGPDTESTTDACMAVKQRTNPDYGGDPVGLDELRELTREASDEHFPNLDYRSWCLHPSERHTFVEAK